MSEFSRLVDVRRIDGQPHHLVANVTERAALAQRFGLVAVDRLEAEVTLDREGAAILASGGFAGDIVQSCAVTGEDLPVAIAEELALRFVPTREHAPDEELELTADELDEIEYSGQQLDLGEAVAQSLALAIDPYAVGPNAAAARDAAGLLDAAGNGPFAALKGLIRE